MISLTSFSTRLSIDRDVLGMIMADDYEVIYAENGLEALEKIRQYQEKLSAILLDLMMPVMDGFAVLAVVHGDESLRRIPVIVLTAKKNAELKALQMGAADFITKPFDMHEVIRARAACSLVRGNYKDHLMIYDEEMRRREILDQRLLNDLKLEVTESAYTDNRDELIAVIHELRKTGFEIEMDDFGSGYSSLNMLSSMPVDVLKIDRKFISEIERSEKDFKLVELILDIAGYLKIPVIAEGVETKRQLEMLHEAGCDLVQGFYFSRAVPPEEFEKLI